MVKKLEENPRKKPVQREQEILDKENSLNKKVQFNK